MKEIFKLKRLYLLLFFPLSALLVILAKVNNVWVEKLFVPFIYKPLSFIIGSVSGIFPFSVSEILFVAAVIFIIIYIVKNYRKPWLIAVNALCTAAVLLFLFEICMGLNYYRFEAKEYLNLEIRKSSAEELYELCSILAEDMNDSRKDCKTDKDGAVILSDGFYSASRSAKTAYKALSEKYPFLKSANIGNKPLVSSKLFSRFMTTGIYIPYTFESNINKDVPEHTIPATMCHELTHYRGFMRENEANFLGYLACTMSDMPEFRYSGALMAFSYAYPKLYDEDTELAAKVRDMLCDGIITDLTKEDEYWSQYEGTVIADTSDKVYDSYLNANGQTSGIKSYGEMVDLLLAYYRK